MRLQQSALYVGVVSHLARRSPLRASDRIHELEYLPVKEPIVIYGQQLRTAVTVEGDAPRVVHVRYLHSLTIGIKFDDGGRRCRNRGCVSHVDPRQVLAEPEKLRIQRDENLPRRLV